MAEAPSRGERVRFSRNRAPPSQIEGEPNPGMMADRAPKESYRDIMQATAAPTAPEIENEVERTVDHLMFSP